MSVTRIALGVILGNILFSIIAGLIGAIIVSGMQSQARINQTEDEYAKFSSRIRTQRYERCQQARKGLDEGAVRRLPPCIQP